jgi:hypothetical protein
MRWVRRVVRWADYRFTQLRCLLPLWQCARCLSLNQVKAGAQGNCRVCGLPGAS